MPSVLNDRDPANNLNIYNYEEDFSGDVDVWTQDIPAYEDIKPQIAILDIETTSLKIDDPDVCILAIEVLLDGQRTLWTITAESFTPDEDDIYESKYVEERDMLIVFIAWLENNNRNIFILTGHNVFNFDIPYIMARCKHHGIHTGFVMKPGWKGRKSEVKNSMWNGRPMEFDNIEHRNFNIIDTMHLCGIADKMKATLDGIGLKYVCGPEGYALRGERTDIEGDQIFNCFINDPVKFFAYLHDDCLDTEMLINFLLPSTYYLLKYVPRLNLQALVIAGNGQLWNNIISKHYGTRPETDIKTSFPGGFTGIQSGVYKNCAKFDVASLYPAIMLAMRIHSKKDYDMYQLKVMSLIRKERLRLKKLGHEGDKEAQYQQLALKILINSGYGVLGTIGISFNDMDAAAMVTAYGRKILDMMIQFCRNAGCKIVQADTDGLIVQHDELKRVHAELQAHFPPWVVIEYEEDYDLVWVYKRKNYITYQGDKVSGIGMVRKRDKCTLYKNYLKYLPKLYEEHGMKGVEVFTENVVAQIETHQLPVDLLQETKKMIEYQDKTTHSKINEDLEANPGQKISFYRYDKEEEYTTPKTQIIRTRKSIGYKRVTDYDNDYSSSYYINEIMKFKQNEQGKVTQEGWLSMFQRSITHPINETQSGELL